jgi:hypothetical protein
MFSPSGDAADKEFLPGFAESGWQAISRCIAAATAISTGIPDEEILR